MTPPRVVLRVDADARIGVGHAVRSITLGGALVDRGAEVTVLSVSLPDSLGDRATRHGLGVQVATASGLLHDLDGLRPGVVVVDGYHLAPLLPDLAARAIPYAVIDDNHELPIDSAALVLNQNLHASPALYPDATARPTTPPRGPVRPAPAGRGGDRPAPTSRGRRACADRPRRCRSARSDSARRHRAPAPHRPRGLDRRRPGEPAASRVGGDRRRHSTRLRVDKGDLVDGYRWADIAVIGAGTTMWEVGYLGLPSLAVIVAENQVAAAEAAATHGFLEAIDGRNGADVVSIVERCQVLAADVVRRQEMSAAGRELFDGRGAARVAAEIASLIA